MAARIPISWLVVVILATVFGFFAYHILQASEASGASGASGGSVATVQENITPPFAPSRHMDAMPGAMQQKHVTFDTESGMDDEQGPAPVAHRAPPIPKQMPHVPGQTEEDLRAPEPLQETPPSMQYDSPEANDAMHNNVFMGAFCEIYNIFLQYK